MGITLGQVKRLRWAVRAALTLGVAASVAANILHARPNPISQAIAAWPPLALLLTVELISRIPVHRRGLGVARMAAAAAIAGIAGWVSYWHMAGVAARYGESGSAPYLLPFSVDGLIVVASVCLVELSDRHRALSTPDVAPATAATVTAAHGEPAASAGDASLVDEHDAVAAGPIRTDSADTIARLADEMPDATVEELAVRAGVSERTVRRYLPADEVDRRRGRRRPRDEVALTVA